MTLAFSCEVVHEKLWKSVNICKSYGKKISSTFFIWTQCTSQYIIIITVKTIYISKTYNFTLSNTSVTGPQLAAAIFMDLPMSLTVLNSCSQVDLLTESPSCTQCGRALTTSWSVIELKPFSTHWTPTSQSLCSHTKTKNRSMLHSYYVLFLALTVILTLICQYKLEFFFK